MCFKEVLLLLGFLEMEPILKVFSPVEVSPVKLNVFSAGIRSN